VSTAGAVDDPAPRPDRPRAFVAAWGGPIAVVVVALLVYLRTLLPGMAFDDWGEMQTVPHVLGVAHPTGYPTYVLLAWAWSWLPIGEVAFRANLLSAVCVALALGSATASAQRLGVRPLIAAPMLLATGLIGSIWVASTVAEVNPLHLLLMALLLDRTLAWAEGRRLRDLALGGLLIGLGLGNHALTLFVAPWLVLAALWEGRSTLRAHPAWLLAPAGTALAGGLVYLYVPIAASLHPPLVYNNPVTWDAFRFLVTGEQFRGQYGTLLTPQGLEMFAASMPRLTELVLANGSAVVPVLGLLGLVALAPRRPAMAAALGAIVLVGAYTWANYLKLEHYLLVPWLVTGVLGAVALEAGARLLTRGLGERARRPATVAAAAIGIVVVVGLAVSNVATVDRSGDHSAPEFVDTVLDALPPDAAIVTYWGAATPLWHAIHVQGRRPDVLVVDDSNVVYEGWGTRRARVDALACERPVYVLRQRREQLDELRDGYELTEVARPRVSWGGPVGNVPIPLYRADPRVPCP
jgi:hypothetical protein